jgi:hypothetical protein
MGSHAANYIFTVHISMVGAETTLSEVLLLTMSYFCDASVVSSTIQLFWVCLVPRLGTHPLLFDDEYCNPAATAPSLHYGRSC